MPSKEATRLQSMGEAHLYAAVAKSDGTLTGNEKIRAPYLAEKAQMTFDILGRSTRVGKSIRSYVKTVLENPDYQSWTANQHLKEAVSLLTSSKHKGSKMISTIIEKQIEGLRSLALLDGYNIKESNFIKKAIKQIRDITQGN
jgi:hypothetical protein